MKKYFSILITAIICTACCATSFARSGDIAGQYYSTDIKTYVNDAEIDSINIGGQTLISAEDMEYYSFSVFWEAQERALYVDRVANKSVEATTVVHKSDYPSGTVIGNYYETDIKTYLDGTEITAYNIGGRTYIWAEEMRDFGYVVDWSETDRKLYVTSPDRAGYEYDIFLSQGERPETEAYSDGEGAFSISYSNEQLIGSGDAKLFSSKLHCDGRGYSISMKFYQNEGLFYSGNLTSLLYSLAYDGNIQNPCDPSEKYDIVNENATVIINGHKSEKAAVMQSQGNGHVDFIFQIPDIPMYTKDEITDIYFSVGNVEGKETFNISPSQYDFWY